MAHAELRGTSYEPFVGTEEVASLLGKPPSFIYNNAERLGLPRYKVGRVFRYRLSEIAAWVERQGLA
jgi:excisionase family DNA binding protein